MKDLVKMHEELDGLLNKHGYVTQEDRVALFEEVKKAQERLTEEQERFRALVLASLTSAASLGRTTDALVGMLGLQAPQGGWLFEVRKELYRMVEEKRIRCVPWYTSQQWFLVTDEAPALAPAAEKPPEAPTLRQKVLTWLSEKPASADDLAGKHPGYTFVEIAGTVRALANDKLLVPVWGETPPLDTARIVYRVVGGADKRIVELELENEELYIALQDAAQRNMATKKRLEETLDQRDKALAAENRWRQQAADVQQAASVKENSIGHLQRELEAERKATKHLDDALRDERGASARQQARARDQLLTIDKLTAALAEAKKAPAETLVLGPREWVVRQSTADGRPSMHQRIYPKLSSALAHLAQHDKDVSIACRLVPFGTPSIPLSLLNEVLSFLRSCRMPGATVDVCKTLADKIDAAIETGIAREQAAT